MRGYWKTSTEFRTFEKEWGSFIIEIVDGRFHVTCRTFGKTLSIPFRLATRDELISEYKKAQMSED